MDKKLTIADIARFADVHKSTVSRYFNNPELVSEKNKLKIQKIVQDHKFRPNLLARTLSKGHVKNIAVIVPDRSITKKIISAYFPQTLYGIGSVAAKNDYNMTLITSAKEDDDYLHIIKNHQAEGFIISGVEMDDTLPYLLKRENIPFTILGEVEDLPNSISYDNKLGGYLATNHLLERGNRNIEILAGTENWFHNISRINGAMRAVKEKNDKRISLTTTMNINSMDKGYEALESMARKKNLPDAIFCFSDTSAMGVIAAAHDLNISIPTDLSLVGYGDTIYSEFMRPQLTTIREETSTLGELAMQTLINIIENPTKEIQSVKLEPTLIIRDSTRHIAKQ